MVNGAAGAQAVMPDLGGMPEFFAHIKVAVLGPSHCALFVHFIFIRI